MALYYEPGNKVAADLEVVAFGVVLDAIVVSQFHYKVVVLFPVANHRLAPFAVIWTAFKITRLVRAYSVPPCLAE